MREIITVLISLILLLSSCICTAQQSYQGFDRNDYPGDDALAGLRKSFSFTSFWLNNPPGTDHNSWSGKRALLKKQGFGFLVLFNGHMDAELKGKDGAALGTADGKAAVAAARQEGFPANVLIFIDDEEGGRMLPEQAAYIFAWADAVRAGGARAGVYCSAMEVPDGAGTISTARDLIEQEEARAKSAAPKAHGQPLAIWVVNDQCPLSPGCVVTSKLPSDGFTWKARHAVVWQYALSPRRKAYTASCVATYDPYGDCYAPGLPHSSATFIDMDVADSADPSELP